MKMEKIKVVDYESYGRKTYQLDEFGGYDARNVGDVDGEIANLQYLGYDCFFDSGVERIIKEDFEDLDDSTKLRNVNYVRYRKWLKDREEDLKETPEEEADRFRCFEGRSKSLERDAMIGLERAWEYFAYKGRSEI